MKPDFAERFSQGGGVRSGLFLGGTQPSTVFFPLVLDVWHTAETSPFLLLFIEDDSSFRIFM